MSKMSQLHADLTEQAADLGFGSIEEAEENGYTVDYDAGKLVEQEDLVASLTKAHGAWLVERQKVLEELCVLYLSMLDTDNTEWASVVAKTIKFIERGEM